MPSGHTWVMRSGSNCSDQLLDSREDCASEAEHTSFLSACVTQASAPHLSSCLCFISTLDNQHTQICGRAHLCISRPITS